MKAIPHLIATALLTTYSIAAERTINVRAEICEVTAEMKIPKDLARLREHPKADLMSALSSTTASGVPVEFSVTNDLPGAGKGIPVGISLSVRPVLEGDRFRYTVDSELSHVVAYAKGSTTLAPVLASEKTVGVAGTCASAERVWLELGVREHKQRIQERGKPDSKTIKTRAFAILTFTKA